MTNKTFISWLPLAVGGTIIMLTAYVTIQQNYRMSANDPQIMVVQDIAAALSKGYPAKSLFDGSSKVDVAYSLSPFGMAFDDKGNLLSSSASNSDGAVPMPPAGIFDYVRANGEDRVSWQTPSGLRFAAVVDSWKAPATATASTSASGFILVARSLKETEVRIDQLGWMFLLGWIGFLILTFLLKLGVSHVERKP